MMRLFCLLFLATVALAAGWEDVERIAPDRRVEVAARDGSRTRAAFVSATADAIVIRRDSGDRSIPKADVREVRVADPARRIRRGILWTSVGAAAGAGIGVAVCPGCPNEGAGYKYVGPGVAIGAGIGAVVGFLPSAYRSVYKTR